MGYTFRRSSGRAWRLRKQSMQLWSRWIPKLTTPELPLAIKSPLIKFASSEKEFSSMAKLVKERQDLGLKLLEEKKENPFNHSLPQMKYGGLISNKDGRIDPLLLQQALKIALTKKNVQKITEKVIKLERDSSLSKSGWKVYLKNKEILHMHTIVLCSSLGTEKLLNPLGYKVEMEPILGQAISIKLNSENKNWSNWPAVLVNQGFNLIPQDQNKMLIGATIEPGKIPGKIYLDKMKEAAPELLKNASIEYQWYGLRGRPVNRPAPILEVLEPGLILATGHYRNGVLLAPASAEWVAQKIQETQNK